MAETTRDPYWQKRWWLEKTARRLRDGTGLDAQDDVAKLMQLPEPEIIRQLMTDTRFGDAIFDFNTYFMGFKADALQGNGSYSFAAVEMSNALLSAQEMLKGGDYFKLFDLRGPVLVQPLGAGRVNPGEEALSPRQVRAKHAADLQTYLQERLTYAEDPATSGHDICLKIADYRSAFNTILSDGYPLKLFFQGLLLHPDRAQRLQIICDNAQTADKQQLIDTLKTILAANAAFFTEMGRFEQDTGYSVRTISDFKQIDLAAAGLGDKWISFSFDQISALPNSSTNMDRKRGAYMLKQFFCDDLTPVGFENPEAHTEGQHGSDTSCFACHFKLDPMAGFFRNFGNLLGDFGNSSHLVFDDGVITPRSPYQTPWLAPKESGRDWNVGFVRSAGKTNVNQYGETLDDLSQILRTAPEVKQCLTRRLFEYFVAGDQTLDAGYLQELTDQLTLESKSNPAEAVKNIISRLLTSQAAHVRDMDPQVCYDFAAGQTVSPADAPPCRVAFLLKKNCASCHGSVDASGNLDLVHWTTTATGQKTFPHLDANGAQIPAQQTFGDVIERLSTPDPARRMPRNKVIPEPDRRELFMWAQQMAAGGAP